MSFEDYMKGISVDDKVGLMFHTDADGVCSGVIVAKTIERLRGRRVDLVFCQEGDYYLTQDSIDKLRSNNITKFIVVDQAIDSSVESVQKVQTFADVLIVDHHNSGDPFIEGVVIKKAYKESELPGVDYPCAKYAYDLCSDLVDVSDLDWVACVGILGDMGYKVWKEFVDSVSRRYQVGNSFNKCSVLISNVRCYSALRLVDCFEVVYNALSLVDVLNSSLVEYQERVKKELDYWISNRSEVEDLGNVIVYYVKPRFKIHSPLASILSFDYIFKPLVVVADYGNDKLALSARLQDRSVSMHDLLRYAVKGLGEGGGHAPAAGGSILSKDYSLFKSRLVEFFMTSC